MIAEVHSYGKIAGSEIAHLGLRMMQSVNVTETKHTVETYFAPAARADCSSLHGSRAAFMANHVAVTLLEAIPDFAVVLNKERQIIAANSRMLRALNINADSVVGMRPGEVIHCANLDGAPGGCGTGQQCASCGAVNAIIDSLQSRQPVTHEARLSTAAGAMDLLVQATFVTVETCEFVVMAMRDISSEKRRQVLERVFFHDVLNTVGGVYGLSEFLLEEELDPDTESECKQNIHRLSQLAIEEITTHRQLLAAERGDLAVKRTEVAVSTLLQDVISLYQHHRVAHARTLQLVEVPGITLHTDEQLLRRILANLVKNALEATPKGGTVTVHADDRGSEIAFVVHNPGVMPDEVQQMIFQRSFSTKGEYGRGVGTYSIKLFAESYLNGHITFTSREVDGTTFTLTLPK